MQPPPALLADIPWLLYRSFFALPSSIVDGAGEPVNALLGTLNTLVGEIDTRLPARRPRCVVACMGAEQADYRVRLYPAYHAHREAMPPALASQWAKAPELLASFGWTVSTSAELEADDVMHSFARVEEEHGGRALLLTGDRDLFGAVSGRVSVLELRKGAASGEIGPDQVRERYGVPAELVPDFIALRGDPSDGLPGAPGIGAKTAAELLRRHGTLDGVLEAALAALPASWPLADGRAGGRVGGRPIRAGRPGAHEMRPRTAAALVESEELLRTFKEIATLQRIEVPRPPDRASDFAAGARAARALGMRALAERLEKLAPA